MLRDVLHPATLEVLGQADSFLTARDVYAANGLYPPAVVVHPASDSYVCLPVTVDAAPQLRKQAEDDADSMISGKGAAPIRIKQADVEAFSGEVKEHVTSKILDEVNQ